MTAKQTPDADHEAEVQRQLALDERARIIIARFRAKPGFMQRVREGYESMVERQRRREEGRDTSA